MKRSHKSREMWELRPRAMTAENWLSELDPKDEIAALPSPVLEELIGGQRGLAAGDDPLNGPPRWGNLPFCSKIVFRPQRAEA